MAIKRPLLGLASLLSLTLNTAWAQNAAPAIPPALPAPAQLNVQANLPALPPAQVQLYRLRYASSDLLAEELYAVFAAQNVRVASDPRTNSVIVGGSPAVQRNISGLIARLDVPQASNEAAASGGPAPAAPDAPFDGRRSALKALQLLTDNGTLRPGDAIAVVKVSPAAARALQNVTRSPSQQPVQYKAYKPSLDGTFNGTFDETPQPAGGAIKSIQLNHDQVTAIANALHTLSTKGANGGAVVVAPQDEPATTSRPGAVAR